MDLGRESRGEMRLLRGLAVAALGSAGLVACATPQPRLAIHQSPSSRPYSGPPPPGSTNGLRGTEKPYQIKGIWYYPKVDSDYDEQGIGSWYGEQFHNRRTANGEIFDMDLPSAAHKTLPLPSIVEVTNLDNGRKLVVRVNDRGPFVDGRIIDLSRAAAQDLGFADQGTARVRVRYVGPADPAAQAWPHPSYPVTQTAAAARPEEPPAFTPDRAYSGDMQVSSLEPARAPIDHTLVTQSASAPVAAADTGPTWRVQAGAFSSRANADHAAGLFTNARVEPMQRGDRTLWRVILGPAHDAQGADALRDQAANAGFADATVLGPSSR